jgi:disulfide bond formation protein DsbB
LLGMLFVIALNLGLSIYTAMDMLPLLMIMIICLLLICYLGIYFERISKGDVSSYYSSFSLLSTVFLFTQLSMIFSAIFKNKKKLNISDNRQLFSYPTLSFLGLFSLINILIVVTLGIVLKFYSTQG